MIEMASAELKRAVETQHGGTATYVQSVPVHESSNGRTIWNSVVQVFDLMGSPSGATRVYAWSSGLSDGKRQFFGILHTPPITGPREAVRSALAAEHSGR